MSIEARCPTCEHNYTLPDAQVGKRVKCRNCADIFVVVAPFVEDEPQPPRTDDERPVRPQRTRDEPQFEVIEDAPSPRKKKPANTTNMSAVLLGIGGLVLLLAVGGGIAVYLAGGEGKRTAFKTVTQIAPIRNPAADPNTIDEATADIHQNFNNPWILERRAIWLGQQPVTPQHRATVCLALEAIWTSPQAGHIRNAVAESFCKWAGPEHAAKVNEMARAGQPVALGWLVRENQPGAVQMLCQRYASDLGSRGKLIEHFNRLTREQAEAELLVWYNHPDEVLTTEIERQLDRFGTTPDVRLNYILADIKPPERERTAVAFRRLAQMPVIEGRKTEVVAKLHRGLYHPFADVADHAFRAVKPWGTDLVVANLLRDVEKPLSPMDRSRLKTMLVRFDTENARRALVRIALTSPQERDTIDRMARSNILGFEPLIAEQAQLVKNVSEARAALMLLDSVGAPASVAIVKQVADRYPELKTLADSTARSIRIRTPNRVNAPPTSVAAALEDISDHSNDAFITKSRAEWLASQKPVDAQRKEVCENLWTLRQENLFDPFVADAASVASVAFCKWADREQGDRLIELAEKNRPEALEALVRVNHPRTAEILCKRLPDFFTRSLALQHLEKFGSAAEPELVKFVNHPDNGLRSEVDKLLKMWETKPEVIVDRILVDLAVPATPSTHFALENLARIPVVAGKQPAVVEALKKQFAAPSPDVPALAAAGAAWATSDLVPELSGALDKGGFQVNRIKLMESLAKLNTADSRKAVVAQLGTVNRGQAMPIAIAGGAAFEPEVLEFLSKSTDLIARRTAVTTLAKIGTKASIPVLEQMGQTDRLLKSVAEQAVAEIKAREKQP